MFNTIHFYGLRDKHDENIFYRHSEIPEGETVFEEITVERGMILSMLYLPQVHRIYIDDVYSREQWDDMRILLLRSLNFRHLDDLAFHLDESGRVYIDYAALVREDEEIDRILHESPLPMPPQNDDDDFDAMYGDFIDFLDKD